MSVGEGAAISLDDKAESNGYLLGKVRGEGRWGSWGPASFSEALGSKREKLEEVALAVAVAVPGSGSLSGSMGDLTEQPP